MYTRTQPDDAVFLTHKPFTRNDLLICGIRGYIFAIHKADGQIIWKLRIKHSTSAMSLFITDNDKIIAGASNKTFAIDLMTGKINWINVLHDTADKEVSVLATPSTQLQYQSCNTSENPPPYEPSKSNPSPLVLACSNGLVIAIHLKSGITQWVYHCAVNSHQLPVAIIEPTNASTHKTTVFVGISDTVHSIDAKTGKHNWTTRLPDALFSKLQNKRFLFGPKYITLASSWSSKLALETHISFNQNPVIHCSSDNP